MIRSETISFRHGISSAESSSGESAGCASCAKPQTNRPRTADQTRSAPVVSAFAERRPAAAGVPRSRAFAAVSSRTSNVTGFTRSPYCATSGASSSVRRAPAMTLSPAASAASAMFRRNPFPLPAPSRACSALTTDEYFSFIRGTKSIQPPPRLHSRPQPHHSEVLPVDSR